MTIRKIFTIMILCSVASAAEAQNLGSTMQLKETVRSCASGVNPDANEQKYIFESALRLANQICGDPELTAYRTGISNRSWGDSNCPIFRSTKVFIDFKCIKLPGNPPMKNCSYGKCDH